MNKAEELQKSRLFEGLLPAGIVGNPDRLSAPELHVKAWEIVRESYDQARTLAIRQYTECADPSRNSSKLTEILPAASHGRVYTLYVPLGAALWGEFDPKDGTVSLHDQALPGDENLLNLAVVHTILNGGAVYALPQEQMPEGTVVASLFRY